MNWIERQAAKLAVHRLVGKVKREENAMKWIKEHKALLGWIAGFIAGGLKAVDQNEAAMLVAMLSAGLLGAGHVKSDAEVKAVK